MKNETGNEPTKVLECHQPDCDSGCMTPSSLPWRVNDNGNVVNRDGGGIWLEGHGNRHYIVRAVNAYGELIEALKQLANVTNQKGMDRTVVDSIVDKAWQAIAKAENK